MKMRQKSRPMMPHNAIAGKRAKEKLNPLGKEMIINGVINSTEDSKKLPCENIHVSSNLHQVPARYVNTGSGEAIENIAHCDESTNCGKSSTKRCNKSNWTSESRFSRANLQKSCTKSCALPVANRNGVVCRVSEAEASPNINNFGKGTHEAKMSLEPECDPLPQTLRAANSMEVSHASFLQSPGNFHKNTRSYGTRGESNNDISKKIDRFRPVVHDHHSTSARVQYNGHDNVSYTPFNLPSIPPPPIFPFLKQHSFYPSTNFPSNPHIPQWNCMQHQRPPMRNVFPQNRQFPEHMYPYRPCHWRPTQHQASRHDGVDTRSFTHSSAPGDLSNGSWYHNTPLPRNYGVECTKIQNSDPTRDAFKGQKKARSTKGNMKDKHKMSLNRNSERYDDHGLQQAESLHAINPSRISDVFSQCSNEQSSGHDTLKKHEQSSGHDTLKKHEQSSGHDMLKKHEQSSGHDTLKKHELSSGHDSLKKLKQSSGHDSLKKLKQSSGHDTLKKHELSSGHDMLKKHEQSSGHDTLKKHEQSSGHDTLKKHEQSSGHDTLKKHEQKQTVTNVHCKDSDAILEEGCFHSDRQQTSHLISGHSRQNEHLFPNADSALNRPRQEAEQRSSGKICDTLTNSSENVNPVTSSYSAGQTKASEHGRNSPHNGNAVNNCKDVQSDRERTNSDGSKCNPIETNYGMPVTLNVREQNNPAGRKYSSSQTQQIMDFHALSEAQHTFKSNTFSSSNTPQSLPNSSVHPSHAVQSEHTKDHYTAQCFKEITEIKPSSGCANAQCRAFANDNEHFTGSRSILLNNTEDVTEQITETMTVSLNGSTSNPNEDIIEHCMKHSGRNDPIHNIGRDVCEPNVKQEQTDLTKKCHKSGAPSKKLNPGAASFSLAIKDEIEKEMARAQSMLIPVNINSKKSTQLISSHLNPDANDFCPKLLDSHGRSFVMTKQKGTYYFQTDAVQIPVNETATSSDPNQSLDTQYMAGRTCNSGSVFNFVVSFEDYNLTSCNFPKTVDSAISQTYDQQMESSQYLGQEQSLYTNLNTALIDSSVISRDVYLTDAIVPSPIASAEIPEFSYRSNSNHFDTGSIYSTLNSPYYNVSSPYADHQSTPYMGHYTDTLSTVAWGEQLNQTETHFESPGYSFLSFMPVYPVASSPMISLCGTDHVPVIIQTQPVPCMRPQTPFPAHALSTQYHPSPYSTVEPYNTSLSQAPVLNLQAYYATTQESSFVQDANDCDEIYVNKSNPISFTRNPEIDVQYSFENEEMPTKNELVMENCPNSWSNQNNADFRLVGSTACPLSRKVGHNNDARGCLEMDTASSNDVSAIVQQASPIFPNEISISEYDECKVILEKLKDNYICLDHFRRVALSEPESRRRLMEKWMEIALRIIEESENKLTIDEMAVSMFSQSPKISGFSAS